MFDEFAELRKVREAAHLVAADAGEDGGGALDCMAVRRDRAKSLPCPPPALCACADWPALYDEQRLQENTVPVAAASYYDVSPRPAPLELHTLR